MQLRLFQESYETDREVGRANEALVEYLGIYESSPESVWVDCLHCTLNQTGLVHKQI